MLDIKQIISSTISESTPPWVAATKDGRDLQNLEGIVAAQIGNSVVNKNVADLRNIDDGPQKKMREAEATYKKDAETNYETYVEKGGTKSLEQLKSPRNLRKEWERDHLEEWKKAHPAPKDQFRH